MNILGLIPARGGSKGIPGKNIYTVAGKPLIAHTIAASLRSHLVTRTLVSTDADEIASVALEYGAEVPFLRPVELAQDNTPALPVIEHAIHFLDAVNWSTDIIVYLQPTSPLRQAWHIDASIEKLLQTEAETVVSVTAVPHRFNPVSVMTMKNGALRAYHGGKTPQRRQDKPVVYARNGPAVLVCRKETIIQQHTLYGKKTVPLFMTERDSFDIDSRFDMKLVELIMNM